MNNRKTAGKIQLILTLLIILFTALWVCSIMINVLFVSWLQWGSGGAAVMLLLYFMGGGFYYVELSKPDDHFEIKFYNSFPFSREFKMYRVPVSAFIKYEMDGWLLYRRKLFLFQMSASQMAKYPPIYMTAFSGKDKSELKSFFDSLKE